MLSGNPWTAGIFVPYKRSIGGIIAQVTISEQERDELTITEHPVEQGAPISDHAFKRPSEVTIRAGWGSGSGNLGDSGGAYGILLSWQAALNPFDLYTGKRHYKDMLISSISVTTDSASEYALMAEIVCKQVIIVKTSTAAVSTQGDSQPQTTSSDNENQKDTESTSHQQNNGDQNPSQEKAIPNTSAIDKTSTLNVPNTSAIDKGITIGGDPALTGGFT